jgi:ABC-type uncharacterized transport system involved in gliding motility auxiliary subunit
MNNTVKTIFLGLIAASLAIIAYSAFTGKIGFGKNKETETVNYPIVAPSPSANPTSSAIPTETATPASNVVKTADLPKTSISFKESSHDFGDVKQDSENTFVFSFTNTGKEPLLIENAKGSCGCTVPEYPKSPVEPGKTGEIKVVYKPGKQKDIQTKSVTVTANTEPLQTVLTIKANVQEVK